MLKCHPTQNSFERLYSINKLLCTPNLLCKVTKTGNALLNRSVPCLLSDSNLLIFNDKDNFMQFVTTSSCAAAAGLKDSRILFVRRAEKQQTATRMPGGSAASLTGDRENQALKIRFMDVFCCHYKRMFDSFCQHCVHIGFNNLIGAEVQSNHFKFPGLSLPFLLIIVQFLLPSSLLEL